MRQVWDASDYARLRRVSTLVARGAQFCPDDAQLAEITNILTRRP